MTDLLLHWAAGMLFAGTGWAVRSACSHRGLLPHPVGQVSLTAALVAVEAWAVTGVIG